MTVALTTERRWVCPNCTAYLDAVDMMTEPELQKG